MLLVSFTAIATHIPVVLAARRSQQTTELVKLLHAGATKSELIRPLLYALCASLALQLPIIARLSYSERQDCCCNGCSQSVVEFCCRRQP